MSKKDYSCLPVHCIIILSHTLSLPPQTLYEARYNLAGFEVLTEVVMKSSIFWDITTY
jgi:hypothetical protein